MKVSGLFYYPVKSCGAIALQQAVVEARGIRHDRHWMIVDPAGKFLTQRTLPAMALIQPQLHRDTLELQAPGCDPCVVPIPQNGAIQEVTVWRFTGSAVDQGDLVAQWLSQFLGLPCRLVAMKDDTVRLLNPDFATSPRDQVGFADGYPLLMLTEASVDDLSQRVGYGIPMNRFRPNVVIEGATAYADDHWHRIQIGSLEFVNAKPCERCTVTTVDQITGVRGSEPLTTLATYRRTAGGILMGQNLIHQATGVIKVGDPVLVLR